MPVRKQEFLFRSRRIKIVTTGIRLYFKDYSFISNADMGEKDSFRSGINPVSKGLMEADT